MNHSDVAAPFRDALALIPHDARVAATYHFTPHLSGRRYIYDWPNPFVTTYWGNRDENPHDPATIEWVIIAPADVDEPYKGLIDELTAPGGEFATVLKTDDVVVARRIRPPSPTGA